MSPERVCVAMQTRITPEEMAAAARQLAKSDRGRAALARLLTLLDGEEMDLDLLNQRAFLALLGGAWAGKADVACGCIRTALHETTV
jgi:hypothetical protein